MLCLFDVPGRPCSFLREVEGHRSWGEERLKGIDWEEGREEKLWLRLYEWNIV